MRDLHTSFLHKQLSRDEGRRLTAYKDTKGLWTIGVGHLLGTDQRMTVITDDECDALLDGDIGVAMEALTNVFGPTSFLVTKDGARYRALVNMAFNRGGNMHTSTTITPAIVAASAGGDWGPVAPAIEASPWATQIGARAERLRDMLVDGREA